MKTDQPVGLLAPRTVVLRHSLIAFALAGTLLGPAIKATDILSTPPDQSHYSRPAISADFSFRKSREARIGSGGPNIFVADPAVNNTVPNFLNTDNVGGSEPSIAINPANPNQIVMTSFSFGWGANASLWFSTNGGLTWTEQSSIPKPPGDPGGGPNDQTVDYGRGSIMYGTFLSCVGTNGCNIFSGQTTNPAAAAAWSWFTVNGVAKTTNTNDPASTLATDQPWLLVNRDPSTPGQDNVYVAYDNGSNMRVAVSLGANPPNFTVDNQSGTAAGGVNAGHRLAADPRTGTMYSLFQRNTSGLSIDYMLNRSLDAGNTWKLNGAAGGIKVATADSDQLNSIKFGTVNDLRGGVLHAAVDPSRGELYYVYGNRDPITTNNRLAIRRITFDINSNAVIGGEVFVTSQVQAALPSVAVLTDGTVGVLYDTFDGFSSDGYPIFAAHLAVSTNHAASFNDFTLETFLSPSKDSCTNSPTNCGDKQRVLGDYQQIKAVGRTFYGVFSGNRAPFGGTNSIIDPVFFKASFGPQIQIPGDVVFSDTCVGSTNFDTLYVCNTGGDDLQVGPITSTDSQFRVVTPSAGYPVVISPDFCFPFRVQFSPTSAGSHQTAFIVPSNDPSSPTNIVLGFGNGTGPAISAFIADSGSFGDICLGSFADLNLTINNAGGCTLSVSNITSSSSQFLPPTVTNYPIVIQPGNSTAVPIRFEPTGTFGPRTGTIIIASNDPKSPNRLVSVSGNVPPGNVRVIGSTDFGDACAGTIAEKAISICNVGKCNLNVTNVAFVPPCADFILINNPFPAVVSPDSCLALTIRFTPTSCGAKTCNLRIITDDPNTPVINLTVTANTPCASIDVPPDLGFPPEVIQSAGPCSTRLPFPISNLGNCNLVITNISIGGVNAGDFSISGLPSFPIILEPGHIVGEGNMNLVFAPTAIARSRLATINVTYISSPITGTATTVTRMLCGEGVYTGARVLVMQGGVPLAQVERIHLQRINANRNKPILDTTDVAMNLPLISVRPTAPCGAFQYHREYGTVSNPIQLLPGSYQVTATAIINGKHQSLSVGFNVNTCDFNPTIVINF